MFTYAKLSHEMTDIIYYVVNDDDRSVAERILYTGV